MKILYLTHNIAGVGGSYMRSFSLATHVAALGHQVTLIASRSSPGLGLISESIDEVHQLQMPDLLPTRVRNGGLSPLDTFFRSLWVLMRRFDIIHGFDHRPAVLLPSLLGQRLRGATFISDWADLWGREGIAGGRQSFPGRFLGKLDHIVESDFRKRADGVTVISRDLDRRLSERGIPIQKRMLLPPGANLALIQAIDKKEARQRLKLPENLPIAAFTGFAPYDQEFLVRAVLEILKRHPSAMVISSGAVISEFEMEARVGGLSSRIVQFGKLPIAKMYSVICAADVLLLPYLDTAVNRGRFPNKFGDYLAAGRPIITHRTGDLGEIVEQAEVGNLSSEDPNVFAKDVVNLLDSPDEIRRLGLNAQNFAERYWSWAERARDAVDFYQRILG